MHWKSPFAVAIISLRIIQLLNASMFFGSFLALRKTNTQSFYEKLESGRF